jgi:hypothetical protein
MTLLTQFISVSVVVAVLAAVIYGPPSSYIFDWTTMIFVLLIIFLSWTYRVRESERENFGEDAMGDDMISRYMSALEKTVIYHRGTDDAPSPPRPANRPRRDSGSSAYKRLGNFPSSGSVAQGGGGGAAHTLVIPPDISTRFAPVLLACMPLPADPGTGADKTWRNLAANAPSGSMYCADGSVASSDLRFNRVPSIMDNDLSRPSFLLGAGTSLEGPPSHQLGLDGDRSFTIFFIARVTVPLNSAGRATDVVQIFANTSDNNGFSLSFLPAPSIVGVRVGAGRMIEGRSPSDPSRGGAWTPNADHFHLWVVSKTFTDVRVQAVDLESKTLEPVTVLQDTISESVGPIIISNLPMRINKRLNWSAGLMMFGMGAKRVETGDVIMLANHYRSIFRDLDPEVLAFKARIKEMGDRLARQQACPFNEAVCVACDGVADWSAPDWYLSANEGCLRAVDSFCRANPSHPRCKCWATSGDSSFEGGADAARCRRYRAVFDPSHNACPATAAPKAAAPKAAAPKAAAPKAAAPETAAPETAAPAASSSSPPPPPPPRSACLCKICKNRVKRGGGGETGASGCNRCEMCKKLREMKDARAKKV